MLWKVMTSVINGFERRIIKSPFERLSRQNRWLKVVANIYQFLNKNVRMSSDLWPPKNPCSPATN